MSGPTQKVQVSLYNLKKQREWLENNLEETQKTLDELDDGKNRYIRELVLKQKQFLTEQLELTDTKIKEWRDPW